MRRPEVPCHVRQSKRVAIVLNFRYFERNGAPVVAGANIDSLFDFLITFVVKEATMKRRRLLIALFCVTFFGLSSLMAFAAGQK